VLDSGVLVQGPETEALEKEWAAATGAEFAVATSSGTAALELALMAHGIGPGDEVITTSFTFIATANAILRVGATPVFVDIEEDTFNLDATKVERAITKRTKAIVPVDLFGLPCDLDAFEAIARANGLALIDDAAQAIGATYKERPIGSFGTTCFSLYATKNAMSGEGGIITTPNRDVARRCRMLRSHGRDGRAEPECVGTNARMSELHAALGRVQLSRLPEATRRRRINAAALREGLVPSRLHLPSEPRGRGHGWHQFTVRVLAPLRRDEVAAGLSERGVGSGVYYTTPCHRFPFVAARARATDLPITERAASEVLSLPVHPLVTKDELVEIRDAALAASTR
jgi:dTDP-4-amino-4,6-dideoxygalactose transaminase